MTRRYLLLPFVCFLLALAPGAQPQRIITTVAGGGPNNMPATSANLYYPRGVAVDAAGDLYISALSARRVFKVDPSGQLIVYAGNGSAYFSGDGGPANNADLHEPSGVALDSAGNLYIAETYNNRIRKVNSAGIITTVAGNGNSGFSGDGGPATSARLASPSDVALDGAGNLFIADTGNHRIRKVNAAGTMTTVAGNGIAAFAGDGGPALSASLNNPQGVALDAAGNLYVADMSNHRIRKVSTSGFITTIAGNGVPTFSGDGGPATSASLYYPYSVAFDFSGSLHIADFYNGRVRKVDATGTISTVAGGGSVLGDGGPATNVRLAGPSGLCFDAEGNLYIADLYSYRVRKVDSWGTITTVAGNGTLGFSGDGGPATDAGFFNPISVAFDSAGNLHIADWSNHIRRVDATGNISTLVSGLIYPTSLAFDRADNLYIADSTYRILKVAANGTLTTFAGTYYVSGFAGDGGPATSARLNRPSGLALDAQGNLFIADTNNHRIRKVDALGIITTVAGDGAPAFAGDGGPATSASLNYPQGLALDAAGNLYISDTNNHRIRMVDPAGMITTVAGNGSYWSTGDGGPATSASFGFPTGIALDAAGNLYFTEWMQRIREVDTDGIISTIAGTGVGGFGGDGGPALQALFGNLRGLAFDAAGNLYVSDAGNGRIRRISPADATPPVITPTLTGTLGSNNWYVSDVSLAWNVSDAESAISSTSSCGSATVTNDTSGITYTCSATSLGGTSELSVTIKRDATPPQIAATTTPGSPTASGWYNVGTGAPTITFACSDETSGLAGPCPSAVTLGEGSDQSVSRSVSDLAGNSASSTASQINVDTTVPAITILAPGNGSSYLLDANVSASYKCSDTLSGVVSCSGPVAAGADVSTGVVGSYNFSVTARDVAGNSASLTNVFSVLYNFPGFAQPLDNLPVVNVAKPGRTIPVKWQLFDANGNVVSDLASFQSLSSSAISCDASPSALVEEQLTSPGTTVFRYDAISRQFIFNWQTASAWSGCRLLQIRLLDGSYHYAKFNFK